LVHASFDDDWEEDEDDMLDSIDVSKEGKTQSVFPIEEKLAQETCNQSWLLDFWDGVADALCGTFY